MTNSEERFDDWIRGLIAGDEQVCAEFWQEYGPRLERLADHNLATRLQRRFGPDEVAQSACRTFFRRAQDGKFDLPDTEHLWRLLCAITLTKIREKQRFNLRQKRGIDREEHLDAGEGPARDFASSEPTPEEAAEFADHFEALLEQMQDEERQLVQLRLEEYTNPEIAQQLGCSERTVMRILGRVRQRLSAAFE